MRFEATNIKDIAKALGFSTSTVSRALRDSYQISHDTKKKISEYAVKINYRPNPIARSLKAGKTGSIGVIVSEIANGFFSQVINGIESTANDKGYNVIISQSYESAEREKLALQFLSSHSIDGLIMSVASENIDFSHINEIHTHGLPAVFFDRVIEGLNSHKVIIENEKGGYDATIHLIKNGYKKIAILASGEFLSINKERVNGYLKALQENDIAVDFSYIKYCSHGGTTEEIMVAMHELMNMKHRPDAIFTSSDKLTTQCMMYCKNHKIKIPEQLALIGFSNLDHTELLCPSLSVVRQPAFKMGQVATDLLIKNIESKRAITKFETVVLPVEIFVRDSSKKT